MLNPDRHSRIDSQEHSCDYDVVGPTHCTAVEASTSSGAYLSALSAHSRAASTRIRNTDTSSTQCDIYGHYDSACTATLYMYIKTHVS